MANSGYADPLPPMRGWWALAGALVLLLVLAPGVFGLGVWWSVHDNLGVLQGGRWQTGQTRMFEPDTRYVVFVSSEGANPPLPDNCAVVGPAGARIPVQSYADSSTTVDNNVEYGAFTTREAGSHRLDCGTQSFFVAEKSRVDNLGWSIARPILVALAIAAGLALMGLILLIVAIVRLVSSSGRRREWRNARNPLGTYGR